MEMEKKNLAIIILAVVLAASGIGNVILLITGGFVTGPPTEKTATLAASYPGLAKNDPVDAWDRVSIWHLQEVTEGLVYYDLSKHPNYEPTPRLAESWVWASDDLSISFNIRQGVVFHDGTPLNADAVKWNFDRLMWFSNETGTVPFNDTSKTGFSSSLYYLPNGDYLFDSFESDGAYNFTIHLNGKFGVLIDLLCFISTNIISPTAHKFYEIVQLDEMLIGTGPWVMDTHTPRYEIRYTRNDNWWGPKPYFETFVMKFIDDDTARMNAGLAGQFDYITGVLKTYIDQFKAASDMHVEDLGEGLSYYYFEIYCGPNDYDGNLTYADNPTGDYQFQRNSPTFRRALAYAINYTYLIEEIQNGMAFVGVPAVPRAFPGHNASIWHAFNESSYAAQIAKARDLIMGIFPTETTGLTNVLDDGTNDAAWKALSIREMRINEHSGGGLSTDLTVLVKNNWDLIGINVVETIREWDDYLDVGELTPWEMDGGFVGWGPDYLNPYNMIDPLFNLASGSCFSRINDTSTGGLTDSMKDAAEETDYATSLLKWQKVQSLIYDIRYENPASLAHITSYTYFTQQVHKDTLKGVQYNLIGDFNWANWYE
ncbi:MAG: ABC transporter substrate-binding protein [Candidatus Lokiarchaeota archaeon]|nr:ABC transporter substrate-binding protein [Candidatus Lokiarchaeota archaeon]